MLYRHNQNRRSTKVEADILHEECRVRFSSFNIQCITGKNIFFDTAIFFWPPCTQAACGWVWCVSVSTALLQEGGGGSRVNDTHNTLTPALDCTHMKGSMHTDLCKHTHTHPHTQHSLEGHVASKPTHPTATLLTSSLGHPLIKPSTPPNADSHNITRVTAALLDVAVSHVILCERRAHTNQGNAEPFSMSEATALHSLATVCSLEGVYQDHTASATLAALVLCYTPQGAAEASCSGHTTDGHC